MEKQASENQYNRTFVYILLTDVTQNTIKYGHNLFRPPSFWRKVVVLMSLKKTGLFPKGWLFAKPKTIQNMAKADDTSFCLSTT